MKKGIFIGIAVGLIFGIICGYFLFVVVTSTFAQRKDASGPLKPNYIKSRFTCIPADLKEECPTEWAVGNVMLEIIKIEFEK